MVKKSRTKLHRKKSHTGRRKTAHLLRYFLVVFLTGLTIFIGGSYIVQSRTPCANSKSCKTDLTEKIENGAMGVFQGREVAAPPIDLALDKTHPSILGTNAPASDKHIYVDLSAQKLYAYEGTNKIFETLTATGRWGKTPTGNFNIWEKLRSTRMTGGSGADYYNLPNVPYVMYFYHDFGLHGAYWHDNFGHTMSHGCVNLRPIDAETLFNWADGPTQGHPGTAVSICDQFTAPDNCVQNDPVKSTL